MVEVKAHAKYVRMSPRKLRFLLADVRKNSPTRAMDRLALTQQRGAKILSKVIKSALANAKQKSLPESDLVFKTIQVDEGSYLRRFRAGSKGMGKPYVRKSSHITVVLQVKKTNKPLVIEKKDMKNMAPKVTKSTKPETKKNAITVNKSEEKKATKKTSPKK